MSLHSDHSVACMVEAIEHNANDSTQAATRIFEMSIACRSEKLPMDATGTSGDDSGNSGSTKTARDTCI